MELAALKLEKLVVIINRIKFLNNYVVRSGYRFRLIKQPSSDHRNMWIKYYKEMIQRTDNN